MYIRRDFVRSVSAVRSWVLHLRHGGMVEFVQVPRLVISLKGGIDALTSDAGLLGCPVTRTRGTSGRRRWCVLGICAERVWYLMAHDFAQTAEL